VGIYDRDYYRQGGSGIQLRMPRTAVTAIILINVAVYVAEIFYPAGVIETFGCHVNAGNRSDDTLSRPWMWWQLLTCGFVHDPSSVGHIVGNMLALFFLGPAVEEWYGTREFVRLYLVSVVFASLVWASCDRLFNANALGLMFGASGAITAVVVLYALLFPQRTLLVFFVLPLPAWLVGALFVGIDAYGAINRHLPAFLPNSNQNVAFTCHLGGAAFALAYYNFRWNFGRITAPLVAWVQGHGRPPLKVFKPDDDRNEPVADEEVDRILTKIHREGEQSLTPKERRVMERASREYRRRREVK
jgi:membrane associated rhomboid family serine protease